LKNEGCDWWLIFKGMQVCFLGYELSEQQITVPCVCVYVFARCGKRKAMSRNGLLLKMRLFTFFEGFFGAILLKKLES